MRILIVGNFLFPFGSASASRIRHFAIGLQKAGADVRVLSQIPLIDRPEDIGDDGVRRYLGIPYESAVGMNFNRKEKKSFLYRMNFYSNYLSGIGQAVNRAEQLLDTDQFDCVLQYSISYMSTLPFNKLCRERNVLLIRDIVEWPCNDYFSCGILHPLYIDSQLALHKSITKSDGVIGISDHLTSFYAKKGIPSITIPAVIEIPEKDPIPLKNNPNEFNLTYLGGLSHRDGPFEMVLAVRSLLAKGARIRLNLVGSAGSAGIGLKLKKYCQADILLKDKIVFLGYLSDLQVKQQLDSANALLFLRPDNLASRAAFPTRLPEYLITGRPVIVSGVGDIPKYLVDGLDAAIVSKFTPEDIASRIEFVMKLPDRGQQIGLNGFQKAKLNFNYRARVQEILDFVQLLSSKRRKRI